MQTSPKQPRRIFSFKGKSLHFKGRRLSSASTASADVGDAATPVSPLGRESPASRDSPDVKDAKGHWFFGGLLKHSSSTGRSPLSQGREDAPEKFDC